MTTSFQVPFVNLGLQYKILRDEIISEIDRISLSGQYILSGDVINFEKKFAAYCGTKSAVAVGNGGDALTLSLVSLGIGKGDEVIIPVNSFIATASAVTESGARVVYADVRDDLNIDPELIKKKITLNTKVIIPVHLTGRPAPMNEILEIAVDNGLLIVEDAAQAVGATYHGKKVGSLGDVGCFSLHPLKNLHVMGDGGIITLNDESLANRIRILRNNGLKNRDECILWGRNSRLDSIHAAIASLKLQYLDSWNERFRKIAHFYSREFENYVTVPKEQPFEHSVYHRYIIQTSHRNDLRGFLLSNGIETKVHYPIPLHLQEVSSSLGYKPGDFPVAERLAGSILSLPIYAELTDTQVEIVVDAVKRFFTRST